MTEKLEFVLGRVEKIGEKGENAGYQHFLLFPQCFQRVVSNIITIYLSMSDLLSFIISNADPNIRVVKSRDCVVKS